MRKVDIPDISSKKLFKACAAKIQSQVYRRALLARVSEVGELTDGYVNAAEEKLLAKLSSVEEFWGVPKKTWNNLYKNHVAKIGAIGRGEYELVKLALPHRLCPFCSVQPIRNVDHFLPESKFPQFSILPANLVPTCRDCNFEKRADSPSKLADQLFHPYFETVSGRWLAVEVHENNQPSVTYKVGAGASLKGVRLKRAQNQFRKLDLGLLYSGLAANELSSIAWSLSGVHEQGGGKAVREQLRDVAKSAIESEYPVEWKVALYEGLSQSEWYYNGGFKFE